MTDNNIKFIEDIVSKFDNITISSKDYVADLLNRYIEYMTISYLAGIIFFTLIGILSVVLLKKIYQYQKKLKKQDFYFKTGNESIFFYFYIMFFLSFIVSIISVITNIWGLFQISIVPEKNIIEDIMLLQKK